MPEPISNSKFLEKLNELFIASKESGSVYLTQKRAKPQVESDSDDFPIIFRATNGQSDKSKKIKVSTLVNPKQLDGFWTQYTEVVKSGMGGLKKKEKKKAKKVKKSKE